MNSICKIGVVMTMLLAAASGYASLVNLTTDNFQTNAVDAAPSAAYPGVHGGYTSSSGGALVKVDPVSATNNVVRVYKNATTGGAYLYAAPLTGTIKTFEQLSADYQKITLSYDVYVSANNKNQFYASIQYGNSGSAVLGTVYFKTPSGGNTALDYLVAGGSATASGLSISADKWYNMTYDIHQLAGGDWAFSASVMDKTTGISQSVVADGVAVLSSTAVNSVLRLNFYQFGSTAGESFSYIDNIALTYNDIIPEPATVSMVGVGALLMVLIRRSRA